ncbi:MAG TPA: electron transfer flavoprotein subunit alpha/FixB family protein [Dehalococcoidia bacterium]|nr:electron transfer flavoprotein subunit alpha/FixB family protein [Dehalococcoidia bacterium]
MGRIFVLIEHRKGAIRDITWEMLIKGRELALRSGGELTALLLGYQIRNLAEKLVQRADEVLVVEDEKLSNFNGEIYQRVLSKLISEYKPALTLIGHTSFGMELAGQLELPITTDCIDLCLENGALKAVRQMYTGKVNAEISFIGAPSYIVTVRPDVFPAEGQQTGRGEIKYLSLPIEEIKYKKFIEYIEPAVGEVDITRADILVSVGQGIGDKKNISMIAELSELMGGVLACSRPIVDKKWLPKERQVGLSGKTVKPKLYLAIGISGAFQHISQIKGGHIIAINKDPRAPIFGVADYGIVEDLFKIVPVLTSKLKEIKAG